MMRSFEIDEQRTLRQRLMRILKDRRLVTRVLREMRRPSRLMVNAGFEEAKQHVLSWHPNCYGDADLCVARILDAVIEAEQKAKDEPVD